MCVSFINFDDYTISGYANQDKSGSAITSDAGFALDLAGNTWVDVLFNSKTRCGFPNATSCLGYGQRDW